jgi:hypothetical protein
MRMAVLAVLPLVVLGAAPPVQAGEPGSGFASLELSAIASGVTYNPSKTFGQPVEVSSPFVSAIIHIGGGNGIASIAWPGQLGSSLGTTVIVAGGAPAQAEALNDPVLANAKSGTKPDDSNTSVPGSTMTAHAVAHFVTAAASAAGVGTQASTTGASYATSSVKASGPTSAIGDAASSARDISIGGVVHIGGVMSSARGTTNGTTASATGRTEVTEVTVAGQAISIGTDGISIAGATLPTHAALAGVESALAQAMITMTVSQPTTNVSGGSVQYATGSLIISTPFGVTSYGGATLNLAATPALGFVSPPTTPPHTGPTEVSPPVSGTTGGSVPSQPLLGNPVLPTVPAPATDLPEPGQTIVNALKPLGLTTGYRGAYVVLGLLLAVGFATAFAGLPYRWLPALNDSCPLEKNP